MDTLDEDLNEELEGLRRQGLLRACPPLSGASRVHVLHDGNTAIAFCSNDYLGLAAHPSIAAAAAAAFARSAFGAGASRLVTGDLPEHRELESALADFVGAPSALLFSSGFLANLGLITSLAGPEDLIASDRANHASIIDGCRLSGARIVTFRHADPDDAAQAIAAEGHYRRRLLVTESVFSMEGDLAPLLALRDIARAHRAALVVDEAHALGAIGPCGRGVCAAVGVVPDALVGTLGKALGTLGGFVAGSSSLRAFLVNRARTFLFTTAPPPPLAAAALAALAIVRGPEGEARRARLAESSLRLGSRLGRPGRGSAIFPVVMGSERAAMGASRYLLERGLFVQAIRPPTVPEGTARLRITLSAEHEIEEVDRLASALLEMLHEPPR